MATDYKFAIRCWQDEAGDEDTKVNVFLNGAQVLTDAPVSGKALDDTTLLTFDATGLGDVLTDTIVTLKIAITNTLYVDESTDRNVYINGIGYIDKDSDGTYKKARILADDSGETPDYTANNSSGVSCKIKIDTVSDFTAEANYVGWHVSPESVESSSLASDWWATVKADAAFHTIPLWGDETDGVTIKYKIDYGADTIEG